MALNYEWDELTPKAESRIRAAERERCARIVEAGGTLHRNCKIMHPDCLAQIAADIRNSK